MSAFATLGQVFTDPAKAFESLYERSNPVLPLLLLILGSAALMTWYYQVVDMSWLIDQMLAASPQGGDPAARAGMEKFMTPATMTVTTVVSIAVMLPLILLLTAVYYLLSAKVVGSEIGFGKWFSFAAWASVPTLLTIPAGAVAILMASNGQLGTHEVNPLTLNQLFFHLPMGHHWQALLDAVHLPMLWSLFVSAVGYRVWTKKSAATSWIVVSLPYVLIFGIWALVLAFTGGA
ncbi:YIP1 family protein [Pseudomarimonas salicorniae]|uniref:YIP1 family protein n=1 Tax=Pseudomarimonas salicorniae TaxID=2933270 RepID=A0ABT0GDQ5_9GAMM|nr:YIP1 family protein [Lysobacter sp. CAU 1642]MCK7592683.1 YIP1 family protein [Lysobacter sp. CAU 1642]